MDETRTAVAAAVTSITSIHMSPRSRLPSAGRKVRVVRLGGMGGGDELLSGFIEMEELMVALTLRALNDTSHGAVAMTSIASIHLSPRARWPSAGRKVSVERWVAMGEPGESCRGLLSRMRWWLCVNMARNGRHECCGCCCDFNHLNP